MLGIQKFCRRFNIWHSTVVVMLVAGCGGGTAAHSRVHDIRSKGRYVLADGKPLTAGRMLSSCRLRRPRAAAADIGSDGAFEFKGPSGDGLPAANYKVRIIARGSHGGTETAVKPAFASKYLDEDESGLTATVTTDESKNQFEFKLDTKDAAGSTSRVIGGDECSVSDSPLRIDKRARMPFHVFD